MASVYYQEKHIQVSCIVLLTTTFFSDAYN